MASISRDLTRAAPFVLGMLATAGMACSEDPGASSESGSGASSTNGSGASSSGDPAGTGGTGNSSGTSGGSGGIGAAGPCAEGSIEAPCDCNGSTFLTGYCCSEQWFDPYYETLIGGCPSADAFRYVDPAHPSASDAGPGTADEPWATIEHGVSTTSAGQVLIVRPGTYRVAATGLRYDPALNPQSGSAGAPVIIKADGEVLIEPAVVSQGTAQGGTAQYIVLAASEPAQDDAYADHHVRIVAGTGAGQARQIYRNWDTPEAIVYEGASRTAWVTLNSESMGNWQTPPDASSQYELVRNGPLVGTMNRQHVVWDGFHVREVDNYHPDTGVVVIWDSQNVVLLNNDLEGQLEMLYDNHNIVRLNGAMSPVVRNNRLHGLGIPNDVGPNNPQNHAAIMIYASHDAVIEHNEIYDSYTGVFPKGQDGSGHAIRYNVVRNCVKAFRFSYHLDLRVHQNAVYDCEQAFQFAENIVNISVYNNVVHGSDYGIHNWFSISGASAFNNVFLDVAYPANFEAGVGSLSSDRNVFASFLGFVPGSDLGGWQSLGYDQNSIEADPQFVDAAAHDYRVVDGSLVLTAGRDEGDLDGDGDTTETIPAGAYVTGAETIGRFPEP